MKLLHTNDWHCWQLTPSSRLDSWPDALWAKLDQIAEIARIEQVDAIVHAGDVFHSVHTSYAIVNRLISWAREQWQDGIAVLAIPGNHDMRYNRRESVLTSPIGSLFASRAFVDVSYQPYRLKTGAVIGIPWPDAPSFEKWVELAKLVPEGCPTVVLAHAFASLTGGLIFKTPVLSYAQLSALPFQAVHFGHDHSAMATQMVNGKLFMQFGALGRGSLAAEELSRQVFVGISETLTGPSTGHLVKLRVEAADKIFDLRRYAFEKHIAEQFESTLGQQISADFLALSESTTLADRVALLQVDAAVRTRLQQYLTAAEESV